MIVERFNPEHLLAMNLQPAQEMVRAAFTQDYLDALQSGPAITGMVGGRPVACGGVVDFADGSMLWAFMARDAGPYMRGIVRGASRLIEVASRPVLATAACDFEPGCRLLRLLGFTARPCPVDGVSADGKPHYVFERNHL